ncbi:AraC family transcriptional regulator [Paenibacillus sp. FSL R7-277]|uniref:response regulator transcription factor n=1 Tax=Paenibacillus sp. FSL R7-277 TaxID=1227352 RepID=UPI0003E2B5FE|nr:response regulator [Paenibacillus sp. FSL R7-277]ETT69753.1 AraC family transcriptional regulator [Paenibacillus sp. FSL R7-277]
MSTAPVARVLIVDDEYYFRQLLIRLVDWEAAGFEVAAEADDGTAALQIIGEQPIDLIITDIEMPNMNGLEFIGEVRKLNSAAKLIFITSYDNFSYAQQAISLGADHYLLKPVDEDAVEQALRTIRTQLTEKWEAERYINRLRIKAGDVQEPQAGDARAQKRQSSGTALISKTIAYVTAHYAEDTLSLQSTASALFVNPSYLSHAFKKETGESFVEYVTNVRLGEAMKLLSQGATGEEAPAPKIATIARQVGYKDPFYFSKCFKKRYGMTPNTVYSGSYSDT